LFCGAAEERAARVSKIVEEPMLNAILHGKKRGTRLQGIHLHDNIDVIEDTLTSTVFERLLYLPDAVVISILFHPGIWMNPTTDPPNEICGHEFWPWWEPPKLQVPAEASGGDELKVPDRSLAATGDQRSIEPDLKVEFNDRVLIVESKRRDSRMQKPGQLADQYSRALTRFPNTPVWLLAVGGLSDERWDTKCKLQKDVLAELCKTSRNIRAGEFHFAALAWRELFCMTERAASKMPAHRRLMADLRDGVSAHGIRVEPFFALADLALPIWRSSIRRDGTSAAALRLGLQSLRTIGISPLSIITLAPRDAQ
jgi:hypothetical protein